MNCPVCDERMREVDRIGVTIDICPSCKGVWLDRGELDKLLRMAEEGGPVVGAPGEAHPPEVRQSDAHLPRPRHYDDDDDDDDRERRYERREGQGGEHRRRKGSWLGEVFDMFGD